MTTNDRREHLKAQLAEKLRAVEEHAELRAENERLKTAMRAARRAIRGPGLGDDPPADEILLKALEGR